MTRDLYEVSGSYGGQKTPCTVLVCADGLGSWYCVEGSQNVNFTFDPVEDGVYVEELSDIDYFYWDTPITTLEELEHAVDS